MNERLTHARRLGRRIDADWQRDDVEAQLTRLHARQRMRARRRMVAAPLLAAAVTAAVLVSLSALRAPVPPSTPAVRAIARAVAAPEPAVPVPTPVASTVDSGVLSLGDG